jgi:nuclear pore complex protein Nup93
VDYLCLICLNSDLQPAAQGQNQTRACHECLRELCLETREFPLLLGDVRRSDGARIPGAIEQRKPLIKFESRDEFLRSITTQSATIADQRGQIADAVLLYHLCEEYDQVIDVLNRALADAVTLDLGDTPMELQPLKGRQPTPSANGPQGPTSSMSLIQSTTSPVELAKIMTGLYNREETYFGKISNTNREICGGLLRLAAVRRSLESDPPKYLPALQELNELGALPLQARGSIPNIRAAAQAFGAMQPLLARCVGIAIVWAVKAIGGERERIARQGTWDAGYGGNDGDGIKDQLSSMAKDLMVFAGLVKYKLPARVYDMLTKAGGDVGAY